MNENKKLALRLSEREFLTITPAPTY